MKHSEITSGSIHTPFNWIYASATDRTAAVGFRTADVNKTAVDLDSGEIWLLKAVDGSGNATWQSLASALFELPVRTTVVSSGTAVAGAHGPVDATSANLSRALPTGQPQGTVISIEKTDATTHTVSITGNIRDNAGQTLTLQLQHEQVMFITDAAGSWWPIAGHKTLSSLDARYDATGAAAAAAAASIPLTQKGANSGVGSLDSSGRQPIAEAPASVASRDRSRITDSYPAVAGSPPALSLGAANGATGIASGTDYLCAAAGAAGGRFTYIGRHILVSAQYAKAAQLGSATVEGTTRIEYMTDAPNFEIMLVASGWPYRIRVNGLLTDGGGARADLEGGGGAVYRLTLSSLTGINRITVEGPSIQMKGVRVPNTYAVWPSTVGGPKALILGDSFVQGNPMTDADGSTPAAYAYNLACLLGFPNAVQSGVAGTGLLATNGSTRPTYRSRVTADVLPEAPDWVHICGSVNDESLPGLQAEQTALIIALRAALPNVVLTAASPVNRTVAKTAADVAVGTAMAAACAAATPVVPFIDLSAMWTGTGTAAAPAGDGNRDRYLRSDITHPTLIGNQWFASTLAGLLAPLFHGSTVA